ncbi:hypothetical protein JHK82_031452 [Glycine max]|uniref:Uncharacterized protein n=1 Tax=Glycine max TaxID=3847 RepID=A0A0R0HNS2_SOYBN|nr:hypothetical protein JHK85_032110 [Glycine max]KAG5124715.1 hypothetical protein JHK82_031452 [Glycine max]KAG5146136.1 hypothetical protein JHK84_031679 [Glycine max]KAH1159621.1 hypothetical protein GYH30_031364 [Glycine max]
MALVERVVVLFTVMTIVKVSYEVIYKVGDSAGWTTLGTIDYRKWAATKNFQIGDTITKRSNHVPQSHGSSDDPNSRSSSRLSGADGDTKQR